MKFIRHYVKNLDDSKIQKCIYWGEIILDETNKIVAEKEIKGFREGEIFVSSIGRTKFYLLSISSNDSFINCSPINEAVK